MSVFGTSRKVVHHKGRVEGFLEALVGIRASTQETTGGTKVHKATQSSVNQESVFSAVGEWVSL